mgnify:CR=1 FL=1
MSEEETKQSEIKIVKVTDPRWVGYLAEPIKQYIEKINIPTITYETLYTYFVQVVQGGGDVNELWASHYENDYKPIAFCNWYVKTLPHFGAAEIGHIYSWNRAKVPVSLLIDEFLEFAYRNRCPIVTGDIVNDAVWKVFDKLATRKNLSLTKTEQINFYGKKVGNSNG